LQNPLNELIKIDPVHIVSGLVEFEVQHRYLRPALDNVLESCVNLGGADLNKCEASYLRHLSGLNQLLAQEIVEHRKKNGPYKSRAQLLEVPGLTPEKFEMCAGFLQVHDGDEPFDATNFHPERKFWMPLALPRMNGKPLRKNRSFCKKRLMQILRISSQLQASILLHR